MNKLFLMGRFTRDTEATTTENGTIIARNALAVDRYGDGTDFINIKAFSKTAEFLKNYGTKGRRFLIEGHIQTGKYEKDGKTTYTMDVIADRAEFADSKADANNEPAQAPAQDNNGFIAIPDGIDEELPFN